MQSGSGTVLGAVANGEAGDRAPDAADSVDAAGDDIAYGAEVGRLDRGDDIVRACHDVNGDDFVYVREAGDNILGLADLRFDKQECACVRHNPSASRQCFFRRDGRRDDTNGWLPLLGYALVSTPPPSFASDAARMGVQLTNAQVGAFAAFHDQLAEWNARLNLTSRAALDDFWRSHVLDSLAALPAIERRVPDATRVVDVGSGAGLPGLALKIACPAWTITFVEATSKKAAFLVEALGTLALAGADVLAERAEAVAHRDGYRERFDVATARALGPLPTVLELTLPFVRVGGLAIAYRGADAQAAEDAGVALERLGGRLLGVERALVPGFHARHLVLVEKARATPTAYPRRAGMPAKSPLGARA